MEAMFRKMLVAMLGVLALTAVTASAAQAVEAPHFKVAGTKLESGQSKEIKGKSNVKFTLNVLGHITTCESVTTSSGAKILGSSKGNPGTGEMVLELAKCEGSGECTFSGSVKTKPLKLTLGFSEGAEPLKNKGTLEAWLKPSAVTEVMRLKWNKPCVLGGSEGIVQGSLAATIDYPDKIGEEVAEAKTVTLDFPSSTIKKIDIDEGGVQSEHNVELWISSYAIEAEGDMLLELVSGENWGVFETL